MNRDVGAMTGMTWGLSFLVLNLDFMFLVQEGGKIQKVKSNEIPVMTFISGL